MIEKELLTALNKAKNVLLLEPPYKRQYIPYGLAKIASYLKKRKGKVTFSRSLKPGKFDLICVTTLFTNDSKYTVKMINECKSSFFHRNIPIIVGGIFASLMPEYIKEKVGNNVQVFEGYSPVLDSCVPDFTIDWMVEDPFWKKTTMTFTQRGCPNRCGYCMVWKMEPDYVINPHWKSGIVKSRSVVLVSDNNFLAAPISHIEEVCNYLVKNKKEVIFNNALDCKLFNKENIKYLAKLTYIRMGFRSAFDRMSDDVHYQKAMELALSTGIKIKNKTYTYVLFNYKDTPQEANYRVNESWKFGSLPYFMQYRPLNELHNKGSFIGKYWTENLVKAFLYYGHTYGYSRGEKNFESWMSPLNKYSKFKLTNEDWEAWHYERSIEKT